MSQAASGNGASAVGLIASADSDKAASSDWQSYLPFHVKNTSDAKSWRDAFMKKYKDDYMPHVKNESDPKEWRDAFLKKYADGAISDVANTSDPKAWRKAFMKKYVMINT
eukprot:TRINITY_DN1920_c0_g1_i2.p1 TRINITY_DN1920_c0_g1~~TRINITY_DN1920_c0_g1_i2.p1  ORF type:complete len:121 (+),score=45.33 TRINITY_DN1920_c0_g1_i2:34-363(+)